MNYFEAVGALYEGKTIKAKGLSALAWMKEMGEDLPPVFVVKSENFGVSYHESLAWILFNETYEIVGTPHV